MGDNISLPRSAANDWILVAVIKPRSIGAYHNLADDDPQTRPMLWIDPSFRYELNFGGGGGARTAGLGTAGWDIVIADSRLNQLYVNSATPNATGGGAVSYSATKLYDFFHRDGGQTFQGQVAEMRIYNNRADFGGNFTALYNEMRTKWIANAAPIANAGSSRAVMDADNNDVSTVVTLDGSGSRDPEGAALTYSWTQIPAPTVALTGANTAMPTFTAPDLHNHPSGQPQPIPLTFRLVVSDGTLTSAANVTITVVHNNLPSVANASATISPQDEGTVTLDGQLSTDADQDPLTYTWTQTGGTPVTITPNGTNASASSFTHMINAPHSNPGETLTFTLTVSDGIASSSTNLSVFVQNVNHAPSASAGAGFSVNEGQTGVMLDGSGGDPDGDPLTYAWTQVSGPTAALTGANTASPTFTAPTVALGGQTLTFKLTVSDNSLSAEDTVSVTVVNINHPPVADAGADQSIAEGSPVSLHGENSFDIDNDPFTHAWTQVSGPTVTLTGADTSGPTFTAPYAGTGGATGVVATLVFELLVDDGFAPAPSDQPAAGYFFANVRDRVTVEITNTNNLPVANAGADQTVDENSAVALSGTTSSDPDSDPLTHAWTQTGGPAVTLTGGTSATPSFTAPFVSAGGADLTFSLTVNDGYGGTATDTVVIHVQNMNDPPLATAAQPTVALLWPPNHQMIAVGITGVSDPNNNATITITSVTQDEPTNGLGDGDTAVDAVINADGTVLLRSERSGKGDGRVYRISFTASDLEGSTSGVVKVSVPHSVKKPAIDSSGTIYDSTN
jgi:REJ domain/Bacterial Ig domain